MPDDKPPRERVTFIPFKTAKVDAKGRFYLPNKVAELLFEGVEPDEREVMIYLGPGKRVIIEPATE